MPLAGRRDQWRNSGANSKPKPRQTRAFVVWGVARESLGERGSPRERTGDLRRLSASHCTLDRSAPTLPLETLHESRSVSMLPAGRHRPPKLVLYSMRTAGSGTQTVRGLRAACGSPCLYVYVRTTQVHPNAACLSVCAPKHNGSVRCCQERENRKKEKKKKKRKGCERE